MSSAHQVDRDLLADYIGGALDGTPSHDEVEQLIATSPQWRQAAAELQAALGMVATDLGALREHTEPMPPEVAERIEAALAPRRDPLAARTIARTGKRRRWIRWAAPVAVAAAVAGFFGLARLPQLSQQLDATTSGGAREDAGPAAAMAPVPTITTWHEYTKATLPGASRMTAGTPPQVYSSGTDRAGEPEAATPLQRLTDPVALQDCLRTVATVLPGRATLVEYAYFEGKPALVISVTSAAGQWKLVAGPNCGVTGADEIYRTQLK